jgi:hypothetical protein
MMRHFTATREGQNRLGLRELLQLYANEQWVADHMTPEQAADAVLDMFKRAVAGELELLDLECRNGAAKNLPDIKDPDVRLALFDGAESLPGGELNSAKTWTILPPWTQASSAHLPALPR